MRGIRSGIRRSLTNKICEFKFNPEDKWNVGTIKNISETGLAIIAKDTSFFKGDLVYLRFMLNDKQIFCTGTVMHINGRNCGLRFINVSEQGWDSTFISGELDE